MRLSELALHFLFCYRFTSIIDIMRLPRPKLSRPRLTCGRVIGSLVDKNDVQESIAARYIFHHSSRHLRLKILVKSEKDLARAIHGMGVTRGGGGSLLRVLLPLGCVVGEPSC